MADLHIFEEPEGNDDADQDPIRKLVIDPASEEEAVIAKIILNTGSEEQVAEIVLNSRAGVVRIIGMLFSQDLILMKSYR